MCGIVGVYNFLKSEKVNENLLVKMRDIMAHRGPDDYGLWISADGFTGLGHRRLSIIDISKAAAQPMSNEDSTLWIVFNGEIYNHSEIRPELERSGHKFRTDHSDTEVILHAFEEWGINCIDKFRGMFAFAIWDDVKKELWIARDRIGIKPVYYTINKGRFIFASEIKAILEDHSIKREVNMEGFYHFLSFLTVPAPNTMFKDIYKLTSGCYLKISKYGEININRYWDVFDHTEPLVNIPEDEIAHRLLEELRIAVKYRKVSDVPVGIFLSGGIDSSTNAALFSEDATERVKTFTIGYEGENKTYANEFDYAKLMAERINADHHTRILNMDDFMHFLKTLIFHQDEPIADFVCYPVYAVSKLARDNGIIVCQVGEGSDELFMGYPSWAVMLKLAKINDRFNVNFLKKAGLFALSIGGKKHKSYYEWLKRGTENKPIFWGGIEAFFDNSKKELLSDKFKKDFKNFSSYEAIKPIYDRFMEKSWEKTPLAWMSYLDLNFRLPELLLMRVDKMSMAVSLEARVPFLDHKFVELAMSIPQSVKSENYELKHILKKAVRGIIPDELIDRKKQGFGVPIYEWFFKELGEFASRKLLKFAGNTDYFNGKYLNKLLETTGTHKHNANNVWYLLNFALWHEEWIG
ncbi:MAG: asparagine synthase (glutamine-hydrolyzing) [Actinobacteria bacterium]|nr:asparagine synthase (glutamine-hydrolyzing) [Actinomycetota bacterium]